ncbi:saccharopine dehydrogenase NADP-binding domain-containing protein [Candidatus Pacearchaeota archaeon]|nr:saccharopine dehydrogenase NADP-binding domain-containing protein [Candidatus Pacearchaeota archaeon]
MKFDFCIIGATGMQGRIVTRDLAESGCSVLMCGRDKSRVEHLLRKFKKKTGFMYVDLSDMENAVRVIKRSGAKVVVCAAEGDWNLNCLKACIKAGVHSIDLGSDIPMLKKQLALNKTLKKSKLIHITGCGSVPGIGNVMLNYADGKFDKIDTVEVGFAWDSNIKKFVVPFSIESILEEFTMIAPYWHNHKVMKIRPTDSIVRVYHKAVGKENQFNVGHHPETYTFHKFCKKKGVKNIEFYAGFPDHSMEVIQKLVDLGFESKKPVKFKGMDIWPDEFLTELLKRLRMPKGYKETENLWVLIKGKHLGKNKEILMECIVPPLKGWEDAGCNIDTGMPASIMAQMIFKKVINKPGSYSPEDIVPPKLFFKELRKRKMGVYENSRVIN